MKRRYFSGVLILLALTVVFEIFCRLSVLDTRFFPPPSAVFQRMTELFSQSDFILHLQSSSKRFLLGIVISFAVAVPLTILSGFFFPFRKFLNTLNGLLYPLPKSALFPIFLLIFGLGGSAHVFLIAMGSLSFLLASVLSGFLRLEAAGYLNLARSLKLNPLKLMTKVILPGLLPEFLHGLKLGCSYALVLMVMTEMMATRFGLGVFMWGAWDLFHIVDLYAAFYTISFLGFILFGLFEYLAERAADSQRGL